MRILPPTAVCLAWALLSAPLCPAQKPRQVFTEAHYPGGVSGMAFSPGGKRLASVGLFGGLQVRDLSSGKKYTAPKAIACCVAYHPRGKLIATGARDGTITLWDADSVRPRTALKGHTDWVWALSFSSTGNLLASASTDKTVKLWDMDTGKEKATLRHPHYVYEAAFLKGDKLLATGSDALRLWDVATNRETAARKPKGSDEVSLLAVSPDGKTVAFAPDGEQAKPPVVLWDIRTRRERAGPDLKGQVASSLAFSPDGKLLAVGITDQVVLWNVGERKEEAVLKGHYGPPNLLTFSPDSGILASSDYEGTIRLWDVKARPIKSGDVVQVALEQGSIADGLESFYVKLTVAKGWHVYAKPVGGKAVAGPATVVKLLIDGKAADYNDIYYPKGVARKGADGKEYRAYEGTVYFTGWLVYTDTRDAQAVSVRVKVVATDGKRQLKESVVMAELRWPEQKKQSNCVRRRQPRLSYRRGR